MYGRHPADVQVRLAWLRGGSPRGRPGGRTATTTPGTAPPAAAAAALGPCTSRQRPTGKQYVVWNIPQNDPDGGLVAHFWAGPSADEIKVLSPGTTVDTYTRSDSCRVVPDGGVWWEIGTPELATGGWVNAHYLVEAAAVPVDDQQDWPTIASAQVACVYEKDTNACDLLTSLGYGASGSYGLGNSYTQAPTPALQAQCAAKDIVACAELKTR